MDNHIAWVWTYRDDKAVRLVIYEEPTEALEAAGLRRARGTARLQTDSRDWMYSPTTTEVHP